MKKVFYIAIILFSFIQISFAEGGGKNKTGIDKHSSSVELPGSKKYVVPSLDNTTIIVLERAINKNDNPAQEHCRKFTNGDQFASFLLDGEQYIEKVDKKSNLTVFYKSEKILGNKISSKVGRKELYVRGSYIPFEITESEKKF